ncbi:MAG TPA: glutathione S-transferase family protein [Vineibacter sp.]|nr:glutathione S-transferase family protein [Vineibacter sp.]
MQLHTLVGSPSGHKVEAVISHLGLDVEIIHRDLAGGDLRSDAFLALNPNGMVPVLVDGAFTLSESNAIMQYLADGAGSDLFPRNPQKRADVVHWQFWELVHFNKAFSMLAFETVAKPRRGLAANTTLVEIAQSDLARFAPVLERYLAGRRYMVGDAITIADYAVITFEAYRPKVPFDWRPYRHINAYFDRLGQDEHWLRTTASPQPKAA